MAVIKIAKSINKLDNQLERLKQLLLYRKDNGTLSALSYDYRLNIIVSAHKRYMANIKKIALYRRIEADIEYYKELKDNKRIGASKKIEYTNKYYESVRRLKNTSWTTKQYTHNMALLNTAQRQQKVRQQRIEYEQQKIQQGII